LTGIEQAISVAAVKKFYRIGPWLAFLVAGEIGLVGCARKTEPPAAGKPVVFVTPAISKEIVEWDEYTGRLAAIDKVEVNARVSGMLESVHFTDGQFVKQGDLLFTIDARPYAAKFERAEADLKEADAKLKLAQLNDKRTVKLAADKVIAQEEIDSRRNELLQAQAAYLAAKADYDEAKLNLDFTRVLAPISGRISRKLVTEGNLIIGGDAANPTLLTTIVSLDPIYCYFEADEQAYLKYQRLAREGKRPSSRTTANPVELELADEDTFAHKGKMDFVENAIDEQTSTIQGRAVFPNPDLQLTPGLFARVRLQGSGKYEAVLVPDLCVVTDQSNKFVNVVKSDGTVDYRKVTLGPIIDGLRVVRDGLAAGEKVVTRGLQRVRPGAQVDARPDETRGDGTIPPTDDKKGA
jgi:RND family efflux transporter MFP subunit